MSDGNSSISIPGDHPPFDFTFLFSSSPTHELKANKDILSSKCEFFDTMFSAGMSDARVDHMSVDFSPRIMTHFLNYLHHGNLCESLGHECFMELFEAGSFFGCPALCCLLLDSVNDQGSLCAAAKSLSLVPWPEENIPGRFRSFVVQKLGALISEELTGISEEALRVLISVASHGMCWSVSIFQLLERWAQANMLQTLPLSLAELVPFERMWATEFEKHVEPSSFIPKEALLSLKSKVPLGRDWSLLTGTSALTLKLNQPFEWCYGVAVAPQTQLPLTTPTSPSFMVYVNDSNTHTIHTFDGTTGQPTSTSFGSEGYGPSQLQNPAAIAVSKSCASDVFVCDYLNHRVQVFSATGVHKRSFGARPGQLQYPNGLSIDHVKHEVHVSEVYNNRISVFAESDGRYLFSYGSGGQLDQPTGVAVDGERGLVAIVDFNNPTVSVFKTSGEFVRSVGPSDPKRQLGTGWNKFIALDQQSGHIVVSDNVRKRVQVMTWEGEWVGGFGPGLPVRGPELEEVQGVVVGPQGQLFLCCMDRDNGWRVMCL